ncbi:MAG: YkgJ family cysteine cluster protein [Sphaerochaeta sp.]|uniref:YkgJ family cysteine cluster protein n=1 Tax=Sphaerochaeta sp. TaxID=1972642 RepID=UPI002FC928A8
MRCFYEEGLQFACKEGCNYCCSCEPGFVFLSREDLERLVRFTALAEEKFINTYCRKVPMGGFSMLSLLERDNFDCIFLTKQGCSVYEARPRQCRTYPFWRNVMESKESWEQEKQACPGIGSGRVYSKEEIDALLCVHAGQDPLILR